MSKGLFSVFVLLLFADVLYAQTTTNFQENFRFQHLTSMHGLSQRSITTILQDKKGYIWVGTRDGLNKYDGNRFVVYRHRFDNSTSISNNRIQSLFEDRSGNIWIGTSQGLNRYNAQNDNFENIRLTDTPKTSSPNQNVWGIEQIDNDLIWVATEAGIRQVNIKTYHPEENSKTALLFKPFLGHKVRYILKDHDKVWVCHTKNIILIDLKNNKIERFDYPMTNINSTHLNDLPTLFIDHKKRLWLGYEQGLAYFDSSDRRFIDYENSGKKVIKTATRTLCEDFEGNLWIGTYSGLYIFNADRSEVEQLTHDDNNANSLSQNSVYKIFRDSRGDMWIGTWGDGINYYNKDFGVFKSIAFGPSPTQLNYRVVSGMAEDASGNLWIGTEGGGLQFYHKQSNTFSYFKSDPNNPNAINSNNVKSVILDKRQNLWIGMHDGGVNFLNTHKRPLRFEKIDFPPENKISLKAYKVLTLFQDTDENIWIGTLTGGLIHYDTQSKKLTKIDLDIKSIMSIVECPNKNYLMLGGDHGLEVIHIRTKLKKPIRLGTKQNPSPNINCIYIDPDHNYWLGTEGEGLYRYHTKMGTIRVYHEKDGLPNEIVYGILPDNNGNIWLSTNNGLSRFNPRTETFQVFNQKDGLQGNEFNYGSFYKSRQNLFFGGTNGLTFFNPDDIRVNSYIPSIDITNIEVNSQPRFTLSDSTKKVTLAYNENNFGINYVALSYMRPDKNKYAYILEGNDKTWNHTGNQTKAVYTNISPGKYTFSIKGSNNDGLWNEYGKSVEIEVLPAPWRTWWAYLIYAILASALLFYIRKLVALRIKERKEKERIEEINQLKLGLFTDISHDFRSPLSLIIGPLEKMIKEEKGDEQIRKNNQVMLKNAKTLLQLIDQIIDFRKSEAGKLTLQASKGNLQHFIQEVKSSYDDLATRKNMDFVFLDHAPDMSVWFDRIKLHNVLNNLLSNAFKFGEDNGSIVIELSRHHDEAKKTDHAKIAITNFGNPIPEEKQDLIFTPFYQLETDKKHLGSGLGLSFSKKLIELHKGSIAVHSSEIEGTTFSILLPLGEGHLDESEKVQLNESETLDIEKVDDKSIISSELMSIPNSVKEDLQNLLIVEDNLELQDFIAEIFMNKYNVFLANNGEDALDVVNMHDIDLIISDVQMPKMDGFELCKHIKTQNLTNHIPVILLTAKTSDVHFDTGFSKGADAYITKPFNAQLLEYRVTNLLTTRANLIRKFKHEILLEPKKLNLESPDDIFLKKATQIIEDNLHNPDFSAAMFIQHMNTSRTVLFSKLKKIAGQNISNFIRSIRIRKAAQLLEATDMSISQIAYEVGFNDLKYFREVFKDYFHITPSEYKRKRSADNN